MLRIVVLGAAAGGGVPQWNCGCPVCRAARTEHPELQSTQASIAFSADDEHWFLINASPDLRQQLTATPRLHPKSGHLRHSPIAGVILTNSEVDAVAGLLSMREGSPFTIYAHARVLAILKANSIFNVLNEKNVRFSGWCGVRDSSEVTLFMKMSREGKQGSIAKRWSRRTGRNVEGRIEFRGVG